jgi:hypothetical protein
LIKSKEESMDYSTTSPAARPVERPNACDRCGSFRRVREEYLPPTAHFAYCRNFVDHGVLRTALPGSQQKTRSRS